MTGPTGRSQPPASGLSLAQEGMASRPETALCLTRVCKNRRCCVGSEGVGRRDTRAGTRHLEAGLLFSLFEMGGLRARKVTQMLDFTCSETLSTVSFISTYIGNEM